MDSNVYQYVQRRRDFGKPTHFIDSKRIYDLATWPSAQYDKDNKFLIENPHVRRDPNFINLSNMPVVSQHTVNTERVNMDTKRMFHFEGGWPHDVDILEEKSREAHIKKKLMKSFEGVDIFTDSCKRMCKNVKDIIKMNNQIDMYEEYFEGEKSDNNIEKLSVKTSLLFKDPERDSSNQKRCINKISWHPDGPNKLAGAYCVMRFQQAANVISTKSYVWDLKQPNSPVYCMEPPSPICSLSYNHKNTDEIAFGCYNGRVGFCDVRVNKIDPAHLSDVEHSHHEPVVDVIWLSSKLNNEFVTVSTDGQLLWWDNRAMANPTDKQYITEFDSPKGEDGIPMNLIGGTSLEFVPDHGPKYLIGTEKGSIMLATKKPKKKSEIGFNVSYGLQLGRHLGPIYSIKRNPTNYKYFLSVGDWSVNLWEEETKAPIMKTRYHSSYLTDGCWAPNRPGVFFVTRKDGWLDIWDYYYRQNEVAFSHKVSNAALTAIKLNTVTGSSQIGVTHSDTGKFAAIGDNNGTITILELCKTLYEAQPQEKDVITEIFEREKKREEHLKQQRNLADTRKKNALKEKERLEKEQEAAAKVDVNKQMADIEQKFETNLKKAADELYKVYINEPDQTAALTEAITQGKEKKASKDVNNAKEAVLAKANIPADYEKKADGLSVAGSNIHKQSKTSFISTFMPTAADTVIAAAGRDTNGRLQCKILNWKINTEQGDKEIHSFEGEAKVDVGENKKDHQGQPFDVQPSTVDELVYISKDYKGRYVGITNSDKLITCDVDEAKGTVTNVRIVQNCYSNERCCAQMSRDKKHLYFIDKSTLGLVWRFNIAANKLEPFQILPDKNLNEIVGLCLANDETIVIVTNGGVVGRYDINKKSFERSVKFERAPSFVCSHLNLVAVTGNIKAPEGKEDVSPVDVVLLDSEMREVASYSYPDANPIIWMSMKLSVSKFPVILCLTNRDLFALKINKDRSMTRLNLDLDVRQLASGEGLHSFQVFKNNLFVSNKESLLSFQIKGELDDTEKMEELAEKLEEADDAVRDKEDKVIASKIEDQKKAAKLAEEEAARKKKEAEDAQKKREAEIAKELDPASHQVTFVEPHQIYHKINGNIKS
jgi:dynein intermediate chain 2